MAVDDQGLQIKTVEEISTDISAKQRADLDASIDTSPEEPVGQLNGIYADSLRQSWEALQVAYNGFNPDATEGFLLDAICALTGTVRLKAKASQVSCDCVLTAGTVLVSNNHFAHVEDHPEWRFTPEVDFTAPSNSTYSVLFISEELGSIPANAGELNVIATPLTGWTSVTNPLDATLGTDEEKDDALRVRREEKLQFQGSATLGAIRSAVLDIDGVVNCKVFENTADAANDDGLPGHAIEVLMFDGEMPAADNDEIAQAIWDNRVKGIQVFGNAAGTATDDEGNHVIAFSRAVIRDIYIEIKPIGVWDDNVLKEAIVTAREKDNIPGSDVIRNQIVADALDVPIITDVETCKLSFSASPTSEENLVIGSREIASYDTSRITVV